MMGREEKETGVWAEEELKRKKEDRGKPVRPYTTREKERGEEGQQTGE